MWPLYLRNAARDLISRTRKQKTWNSTNKHFIRIRKKNIFEKCVELFTEQHTFHAKM